jgi:hypothetical protein
MKRIHWKAEGSSLSDCLGSQDTLPIQFPCQEVPPTPKHDHHPSFFLRKRKEIYPGSQEIRVLELEGRLLQRPSK